MTASTSTPQDILESAARVVEGGIAPANRVVATPWKERVKGTLESAQHRHFEVFALDMDDVHNTGVDTQTTYVARTMRFGIRLKFKVEGLTTLGGSHGAGLRDAASIADRVCRKMQEHDPLYASSGGVLVSTALNGVRNVETDGPITIQDGPDDTFFFVVFHFRVFFTDLQVTS